MSRAIAGPLKQQARSEVVHGSAQTGDCSDVVWLASSVVMWASPAKADASTAPQLLPRTHRRGNGGRADEHVGGGSQQTKSMMR
jgi:hypothetical protein